MSKSTISRMTRDNQPLVQDQKISFDFFLRAVWALSRTNLHYIDFKNQHGEALKAVFRPVRIGQGGSQ